MNKYIDQYEPFEAETPAGEEGKTVQCWIQYWKMIDSYLDLDCSIKTKHINMFSYTLFELCSLLLVTNQQNDGWMTYYFLELANLKNDKREVQKL